jgi:formylglycine-generating enzyme required for sulfatase activity
VWKDLRMRVRPPLLLAAAALPLTATLTPARASHERSVRVVRGEPAQVFVPDGPFIMGADATETGAYMMACALELQSYESAQGVCRTMIESAVTEHPYVVTLSAFWIDRTEVSSAAYRDCVIHGPCDGAPLTLGDTRYVVPTWPVVNVSYHDAETYCRWRGGRLPSEAEWEKAARGEDGRPWPWGRFDRDRGANLGTITSMFENPPGEGGDFAPDPADGYSELAPVDALPFGASPYGAIDMAGNVTEWVADALPDNYDPADALDPRGKGRATEGFRGGDFFEPRFVARTYLRRFALPGERSITRGFRCAQDERRGEVAGNPVPRAAVRTRTGTP